MLLNCNVIEIVKNLCDFDVLIENEEIFVYLLMVWVGDFIFFMG